MLRTTTYPEKCDVQTQEGRQPAYRREISCRHPLFNFKCQSDGVILETLRPYAAMHVDASHADMLERLNDYENRGIDIVLQTEYWDSFRRDWVVTPETLDRLLSTYHHIVVVSIVEMSCFDLNEVQMERLLGLAAVCHRHGVYLLWEDMGYPDRKHVFAKAGEDPRFVALLRSAPGTIIFQDKVNGWGQYHLTRSLALGYWLTGLSPAWGINVEDFWWYEQGYTFLYGPSEGRAYHDALRRRFGDFFLNLGVTLMEFGCPEALMGQILAPALLQGASIVSFETEVRMIAYKDTLTPLFRRVLLPLHQMALEEKMISTREQVLDKIKAAYILDQWDSPLYREPSEEPFLKLYAPDEALEKVKKDNSSGSILQRSGRYFVIPVVPEFAREEAERTFPELLDSRTVPADKRAWFDKRYPECFDTDACVFHVGGHWLFSHTLENRYAVQHFRSIPVGKWRISGDFEPHTYMVGFEHEDNVRLHLNNFRTDSAQGVFNNPRFSAPNYLKEYIRDEQCAFIGEKRRTRLTVMPAGNIQVDGGVVTVTPVENGCMLEIDHNGPVEIRIQ